MAIYNAHKDYKIGDHLNIGKFHGEILSERRVNGKYYLKFRCDICGYVGEKRRDHIFNGVQCQCCTNRVVVKGINDITTTDPWMIQFFQGGAEEASKYTSKSIEKIVPVCPCCGRVREKQIQISQIFAQRGVSCICKDGISIPNKFIYGLIEQMYEHGKVTFFEKEYKIQNKSYDMYFITKEHEAFIVEMDGGLGHGAVLQKHPRKGFTMRPVPAKLFINDIRKDEIVSTIDATLIRIDCYKSDFEYMKKNVVNSKLSEVLDLSVVDWNRILKFCCSNLVYEVCKYKKDNPDVFASQCAKVFDLHECTIREYWVKGNKLNWCSYDPAGEKDRALNYRAHFYNEIPVVVLNEVSNTEIRFNSISKFIKNQKQFPEISDHLSFYKFKRLLSKSNDRVITKFPNLKIYIDKGEN